MEWNDVQFPYFNNCEICITMLTQSYGTEKNRLSLLALINALFILLLLLYYYYHWIHFLTCLYNKIEKSFEKIYFKIHNLGNKGLTRIKLFVELKKILPNVFTKSIWDNTLEIVYVFD